MIGPWPACHLVPYSTTSSERDLALALDIPMYGADPRHAYLGTKSGCRALFARAGVPHPAGARGHHERRVGESDAIVALRAANPELSRLVVKCNEGVSGRGNAIVDLTEIPAAGRAGRGRAGSRSAWPASRPRTSGLTVAGFFAKLERHGGVIEEWITGARARKAPACSSRSPRRAICACSQLTTRSWVAPADRAYLGCRFPASPSYAPTISAGGPQGRRASGVRPA